MGDTLRKIVHFLAARAGWLLALPRSLRFWFFTKSWVTQVGKKVVMNGLSNRTQIGEDANIYPYAVFELRENGSLSIGKHFTLSYGAIIASAHEIRIGDHVMIGEYSSLRDSTHTYSIAGMPFSKQTDSVASVHIGNNVWIGRGCLILPGTVIHDNVIVAANSVVKGELEPDCIYGGTPVRFISKIAAVNKQRSLLN